MELEWGCPDANTDVCKGIQGAAFALTVLLGPLDSLDPSCSCLARQPQPPFQSHCFETLLLHRIREPMSLSKLCCSLPSQCEQRLAACCTVGSVSKVGFA